MDIFDGLSIMNCDIDKVSCKENSLYTTNSMNCLDNDEQEIGPQFSNFSF